MLSWSSLPVAIVDNQLIDQHNIILFCNHGVLATTRFLCKAIPCNRRQLAFLGIILCFGDNSLYPHVPWQLNEKIGLCSSSVEWYIYVPSQGGITMPSGMEDAMSWVILRPHSGEDSTWTGISRRGGALPLKISPTRPYYVGTLLYPWYIHVHVIIHASAMADNSA